MQSFSPFLGAMPMPAATAMAPGPGPQVMEMIEADGQDPCLCTQLTVLAAFAKELELQSHLAHLNYTGENFIAIHTFLKGRYEAHLEQFDTLAEFVRILGAMMPASNQEFRQVLPGFTGDGTTAAYADNLQTFIAMAKQLEAAAVDERAIDVANYAAELVAEAGKTIWFLSASGCC